MKPSTFGFYAERELHPSRTALPPFAKEQQTSFDNLAVVILD